MIKRIAAYIKIGGLPFLLLIVALILNHRQGYITLIGLFSILVFATVTIRRKLDKGSVVICAYTIFYILFSYFNGFTYSMSALALFAIAPFFFYQFGKEIVRRYKTENYIVIAWFIIVLCYCLDIFYVTINYIIETGQFINLQREFFFSANDSVTKFSATVVGLSMDIGMIGLPMFILSKNTPMRISFMTLFLLSLITTFSLLNRTGIIVAGLCFLIVMAYRTRKDLKLFLLSLAVIVLLIWVLFYFGIITPELIDLYRERNLDLSTMGTRTERWSEALGYLFTHPFGWADYGQTYYVHNMWLDIARISGIIPFSLLAYMAIDSFRNAFKLIKRNESPLSYMILGLNVCFFASCFVEPIFGGTHMMLYCMLWGTSTGLLNINYKAQ